MAAAFRWGIMGTGNIARQFCTGVNACQRGHLAAVASRQAALALAFAGEYGIPVAYGSYDQLLADRQIDAIYVSLPNSLHKDWTIKALRAGKHVLCEKPLAGNAPDSQEMFDVARRQGRVLVEAFMYRAHPLTHAVMSAVRAGAIGQVKLIRSSFCYCTRRIEGNIRFDAALAGGGLMDVGCYCIGFSRLVAGAEPISISAAGHLLGGVDDLAAGTLVFPNGIIASMTCGMTVHADNTAYICGNEGFIEIPIPWKPPARQAKYIIARSTPPRMDQAQSQAPAAPPREERVVEAAMELYGIEADAFAAAVLDGAAPFVSEQDTMGNMRVLDEMRRQIGVRF